MRTAWWTEKPWSLNDQLLTACTAAAVIVTAETNNNEPVDLLSFVDHLRKCFAH